MVTKLQPGTIAELSQFVRESTRITVVGANSSGIDPSDRTSAHDILSTMAINKLVEYSPSDQVILVEAGMKTTDLLQILDEHGQTIPELCSGRTVGGYFSDRPQFAAKSCVLGLTAVLADGTIARCGSKAVKSVAGYDVHKLFLGARGALGVIAQFALRTYPISALPAFGSMQSKRDVSEQSQRFMMRAKNIFDPSNKLNQGVFPFL